MAAREPRPTRVFRNKAGTYCVSVQVSFTKKRDAADVSRALDLIKASAACNGTTLSSLLADVLIDAAAARNPEGTP